jgi:hypothetical protein
MRRPNRPRSADLDRLLEEDVSDGTALAQVLAAARAPGAANELVGLSTAMSAFASAYRQLPRSPVSHRAAPRRALTTRSLLAKTVAAVGGVTLAGGVAYAATTVGFMGIGGGSDHPPALHSTSPGHGGDQDRGSGSSPFGSTAPGAATDTTPARTHAATPSHAVGNPASGKTHRPDPTRPTQSVRSTHASPTRPAPSSDVTPPAPGRTRHPTHSPTPSHRVPSTHPPAPRA